MHGFGKWYFRGKELKTMSYVNGAWLREGCVELSNIGT